MLNRKTGGIFFALITALALTAPVFAQYGYPNTVVVTPGYGNPYCEPYYGAPCYNNYGFRGYAPYWRHGYYHHYHTARNMAIGASIGAAAGAGIGLLASHHGHRYYY